MPQKMPGSLGNGASSQTVIPGIAARQRHDAEARRHRSRKAQQARSDEGQFAFAACLAQRRHGVAREQTLLAIGDERHRAAWFDPRRRLIHPDQRLGPVEAGVERGAGGGNPDRKVGVAFAQVAQQHIDVGAVDLEAQVGPTHTRTGQPYCDGGGREVAGRADPHRSCRRPRPGDVENLIVDRQEPPRIIDDKLARRRQAHARRALVEQIGREQALQPLDLGADRRLRHAQRLSRLGETAQIDDRNQCPQQFGRDIGHATFAPHGRLGCAGTQRIGDCPQQSSPTGPRPLPRTGIRLHSKQQTYGVQYSIFIRQKPAASHAGAGIPWKGDFGYWNKGPAPGMFPHETC